MVWGCGQHVFHSSLIDKAGYVVYSDAINFSWTPDNIVCFSPFNTSWSLKTESPACSFCNLVGVLLIVELGWGGYSWLAPNGHRATRQLWRLRNPAILLICVCGWVKYKLQPACVFYVSVCCLFDCNRLETLIPVLCIVINMSPMCDLKPHHLFVRLPVWVGSKLTSKSEMSKLYRDWSKEKVYQERTRQLEKLFYISAS